jgi:hypothetical protein
MLILAIPQSLPRADRNSSARSIRSVNQRRHPLAFNAGYRLAQDAHRLWQAFAQAHDEEKFVQRMEIPMDNFSRAMEYLLLEAPVKDAAPFAFPPEVMRQAVVESLYIEAQRAYSSPTPKT